MCFDIFSFIIYYFKTLGHDCIIMGFNHNLIKILSFIPCLVLRISKFNIAIKLYNDVRRNHPTLMLSAFLILFKLIHSHRYLVSKSFTINGTLYST